MSYRIRATYIGTALALLMMLAQAATAQVTGQLNYWKLATGNWNDPNNWSNAVVPNSANEDFAVIGGVAGLSGIATGTATINTAISDTPGGIALGLAGGNNGTLQISSGGSITAVDTPFDGNGNVYVGVAGIGTLNVDRGGTLNAVGLNSGGANTSSIRLGGTTGSGNATVVVDVANLTRTTTVIGPNVDFTATNLNFGSTSTLVEQLTTTSHSALKGTDNAGLAGTLTFQLDPSVTPTVGTTWNLINARQVTGVFDTVNMPATPLALGQVYNLRTQNGGLGKQVQLAVEERLVLNVNRTTGAMSISNPGTTGIAIDGYSVHSAALNELNPATFTSLGGTWETANSTTARINQLNPTAAPTISVGSNLSLGNIFAPPVPVAFGTATEDLTFEYTQKTDGSLKTGVINYIGTTGINNLVLRVDPTTGAAQLKNPSNFSVDIDNYSIGSALGSLDVGQWSSLDDQNSAGGDWQEANPNVNHLSELKLGSFTAFGSGQSFNLGNPFNEVTGKRDLTFQFVLHGETASRTGVVVYEAIGGALAGDYDSNGVVNMADYVAWRHNPGAFGGTPGGYTTWRANFGATSGSGSGSGLSSQAIPEPSTLVLLVLAFGAVLTRNARVSAALAS